MFSRSLLRSSKNAAGRAQKQQQQKRALSIHEYQSVELLNKVCFFSSGFLAFGLLRFWFVVRLSFGSFSAPCYLSFPYDLPFFSLSSRLFSASSFQVTFLFFSFLFSGYLASFWAPTFFSIHSPEPAMRGAGNPAIQATSEVNQFRSAFKQSRKLY